MTADQHPVLRLWSLFDAFDFDGVAPLLHPGFVMEWPQSRERIRGAANFVALNANYPGRWRCRVLRFVDGGATAATETEVSDGQVSVRAASFWTLDDGLIRDAVEYWPESYPAPDWRARWVERF